MIQLTLFNHDFTVIASDNKRILFYCLFFAIQGSLEQVKLHLKWEF